MTSCDLYISLQHYIYCQEMSNVCSFEKIKLVSGRNESGAGIACGAYRRNDPNDVVLIFSSIPRGKSLIDQQRTILRTQ